MFRPILFPVGELPAVALQATLAQAVLQRRGGDVNADHFDVDRRPLETLRGRGDKAGVAEVGLNGASTTTDRPMRRLSPGIQELKNKGWKWI
jgi:hypothetical protein